MAIYFPRTMDAPERYALGYETGQRDAQAGRAAECGSDDRSYAAGYAHGHQDA